MQGQIRGGDQGTVLWYPPRRGYHRTVPWSPPVPPVLYDSTGLVIILLYTGCKEQLDRYHWERGYDEYVQCVCKSDL